MHHRVRWENVIRAAGASLLLAVVVAWPRLAPPDPALPGPEPAPLAGGEPHAARPTPAPRRGDARRRARADEHDPPGPRTREGAVKRGGTAPRGERTRRRGAKPRDKSAAEQRKEVGNGETGARRDESATGGAPTNGPATDGAVPTNGGATSGAQSPPDPAQTEFGFESG
jgi:hypothetical protein